MSIQKHAVLSVIALLAWVVFYLIGIPSNYFLDWNLAEKTLLSLVAAFAIVPLLGFFVILFVGGDYFKVSLWFSFYASVLVFVMDYIVVGLVQGHGMGFLLTHWPLTLGYLYVWVSLPLIGLALRKIVGSRGA